MSAAKPIEIYVDADACPVKDEVYRVAERLGLQVYVVTNSFMMVPKSPLIERVAVGAGPDVADDWIAERAVKGDVVITNDVPLADRCVKAGATVLSPKGRPLDGTSICMQLPTRTLITYLRSPGQPNGAPSASSPRTRARRQLVNANHPRHLLGSTVITHRDCGL